MLFCPVCRLYLEQRTAEGAAAHVCISCGGTWLSRDTLAASGKPVPSIIDALDIPDGMAQNPADVLTAWCPVCPATVLGADATVAGQFICPQCEGLWVLRGVKFAEAAPPVENRYPDSRGAVEAVVIPPVPAVPTAPVDVPDGTAPAPITAPAILDDVLLEPLERLVSGNRRFANGTPRGCAIPIVRLKQIGLSPQPWVLVVTCADARVPPEVVFDQPLGELVVIRTPGHVLDETLLSGVEVMVERYGIPLVAVMGHTHCAAVEAAVDNDPHGYAMAMIDVIAPSVRLARLRNPNELADLTTRLHVDRMLEVIARRHTVANRLRVGSIKLVGLYYSVETGLIEQLPQMEFGWLNEPQTSNEKASSAQQQADVQSLSHTDDAGGLDTTGEFEGLIGAHQRLSSEPAKDSVVVDMFDTSADPSARWCPQCRQRLAPSTNICDTCEIPAVTGEYSVECLSCRKPNPIRLLQCRLCQAEMHPEWIVPSKSPSRLSRLFGR